MADAKVTTKRKAVMTPDYLKSKGTQGKVLLVVKKAFSLANNKANKFAGTVKADSGTPMSILSSKSNLKSGSYWKESTDSEEFKSLLRAAKAALPDLQKSQYSASVKNLIDTFVALSGGGRSGGTNMDSITGDFSL